MYTSKSAEIYQIQTDQMYFIIVEATLKTDSEDRGRYGGARVACWIDVTDAKTARDAANRLVAQAGWLPTTTIEARVIGRDDYAVTDDGLKYYEQALVDHEVCVFYTFPKE
jgi:hypothetical protein